MSSEPISLREGILRFERMQRDANNKLTSEFMRKEKGRTKEQSIYFSKPQVRALFDYFK